MAPRNVCFINLKGGVGKSTLSVAFAEYLAFVKGKKVLFIDGDAQCNSTAMLLGTQAARDIDHRRLTIYDFISKSLNDPRGAKVEDFLRPSVSNIKRGRGGSISLIPSTIRFADYERLLMRHIFIKDLAFEKLDDTIRRLIDRLERDTTANHDWVVVDCPPSFNLQGRFVVRLARHAVIPTTPDPLAGHGTNFIIERLIRSRLRTEPLCVVISKFRNESETARRYLTYMKARANPPVEQDWPKVLDTIVPESPVLQRISDFDIPDHHPAGFSAKYGEQAGSIAAMSEEIIRLVRSRE
jgi:chromosome partitioning protein